MNLLQDLELADFLNELGSHLPQNVSNMCGSYAECPNYVDEMITKYKQLVLDMPKRPFHERRFLVLWNPSGLGLGNKMLTMVSALLMGMLSQPMRVVLLHNILPEIGNEKPNLFPASWDDLFLRPYDIHHGGVLDEAEQFDYNAKGKKYNIRDPKTFVPYYDYTISPDFSKKHMFNHFMCDSLNTQSQGHTDPVFILLATNSYFVPLLKANPHFPMLSEHPNIFYSISRYLFRPVKPIQKQIDHITAKMDGGGKNWLGFHLRTGTSSAMDTSSPGRFDKQQQHWGWWTQCVHTSSADGVYIAADNEVSMAFARKEIERYAPNKSILTQSDWHFSGPTSNDGKAQELPERETIQGLRRAIVDMWVLAHCGIGVMRTGSMDGWTTFGHVSHALGDHHGFVLPRFESHRCVQDPMREPRLGLNPLQIKINNDPNGKRSNPHRKFEGQYSLQCRSVEKAVEELSRKGTFILGHSGEFKKGDQGYIGHKVALLPGTTIIRKS